MITQSPDVRDPQHALTWSRRLALCPFWCLDAKGGESLGICVCECVFAFVLSLCDTLCFAWNLRLLGFVFRKTLVRVIWCETYATLSL